MARLSGRQKRTKSKKSIPASKWDRERRATMYTCGVHFEHEMAEAIGPQVFYNSLKDFKAAKTCWKSCGIVEVDVSFLRWIRPETLGEGFRGENIKVTTPAEIAVFNKQSKARGALWVKYLKALEQLHIKEQKTTKRSGAK